MNSTAAARTEAIAAIWVKYPERAVTLSTGVVHVWRNGSTMCSTPNASRAGVADGTSPTCRNCGAA